VRDRPVAWRSVLKCRTTRQDAVGNLSQALSLLDPLTTPWTRELLISTESPWTAYFNNQSIGGDPFPPVSYLSQLLGCRGLVILSAPDGSFGFFLIGSEPTEFLSVKRMVRVLDDGDRGWQFSTLGTPLPFEDTSRYASPGVREKLDDELLERYCAEFGIHLYDDDFYRGAYTLLSQDGIVNRATRLLRGLKSARVSLKQCRSESQRTAD
jgi:hypothetical protein